MMQMILKTTIIQTMTTIIQIMQIIQTVIIIVTIQIMETIQVIIKVKKKQNLKIISGLAWLDKDENGQKDDGETLLQGIKVKLFNTETNKYQTNAKNEEITATTDDKGFYTLADVPQRKYMVVFEYDTSKFTLTAYEKEGTSSEKEF